MIIADRKPLNEILDMVKSYDKILSEPALFTENELEQLLEAVSVLKVYMKLSVRTG